jgi:hypothetical protein
VTGGPGPTDILIEKCDFSWKNVRVKTFSLPFPIKKGAMEAELN